MYIVVIAWLFVALVIAASQASVIAALLSFAFWGILPLGLVLWLMGTPERRRRAASRLSCPAEDSDASPQKED